MRTRTTRGVCCSWHESWMDLIRLQAWRTKCTGKWVGWQVCSTVARGSPPVRRGRGPLVASEISTSRPAKDPPEIGDSEIGPMTPSWFAGDRQGTGVPGVPGVPGHHCLDNHLFFASHSTFQLHVHALCDA